MPGFIPDFVEMHQNLARETGERTRTMIGNRFEYAKFNDETLGLLSEIKTHCLELENYIYGLGSSREVSLAITKLEECYMWAGKALRNKQLANETEEA